MLFEFKNKTIVLREGSEVDNAGNIRQNVTCSPLQVFQTSFEFFEEIRCMDC